MSPCVFGRCDGSGFLIDEETNTAYDCSCRKQLIARSTARSLSASIPRRYRDASFERVSSWDWNPPVAFRAVRDFAERIDRHLEAGRGLWLMGPAGTGKTTLAMLVSRAALQAGRSAAIYSLPRLLNEIRDTYRAERSHVELLDRLTAVDLLHLDDVGAERSNDWVLEELYSIINARYEDQRSILITTNLDQAELSEQIGERTVSRLTEMCGDAVLFTGEDHRQSLHVPEPADPAPSRGGFGDRFGDRFGEFDDPAEGGAPGPGLEDLGDGRSSFGERWHDRRR